MRLRHQEALVRKEIRRLARSGDRLAVLNVEARLLARTCARYGVLTRGRLAELSGASRWTRGRFSFALALAIEEEMIRDLGLGFYAPEAPAPAAELTRGS